MLQTFCNKVFPKDKSKHRQRCRTILFALRLESEFYVFTRTLASKTGYNKLEASEIINQINELKNFKRKIWKYTHADSQLWNPMPNTVQRLEV